ncbi:septum formation family protein [Curtobacterium sp. VKM Ac-2922]|uniref:septum formation family protein n=1 Tax=Curtobacterium sp. VKM Ac-2922 TaxID=2929475 RepID=UPI001FB3961F|nr:septum formation family protein [Curtobacterium sp. VKM Ac-2922]MCJ1714121.1 septum formation family protein [Curtobacterium sp. VKM Ac-2922]
MTEERPDDAREPDDVARPAAGADDQEAPPASAPDARFPGLRSAADIFGAPRTADEWPSRRERREAERAAAETGQPLPEPFEPPAAPEQPAAPEPPAAPEQPAAPEPLADDATQAISMPEELARPSQPAQPASDPDRSLLSSRIPAASDVPPNSTAPHPSAIQLPSAMTHREQRAAEVLAIEAERRRNDPRGEGRDDVDWLGRATGAPAPAPGLGDLPTPTGPVAQPLGVPNALPTSDEPPSFTDLLRIPGGDQADKPFNWAVHDDATGEVPVALTSPSYDTTTLDVGSWSLAADHDDDDDVVSGEIPLPPVAAASVPLPTSMPAPAPAPDPTPPTDPVRRDAPSDSGSWSLVDEAVRTGETPWWAADEPTAADEPAPFPMNDLPADAPTTDPSSTDRPTTDPSSTDVPGADVPTQAMPALQRPTPTPPPAEQPTPPPAEQPAPRPAPTPADQRQAPPLVQPTRSPFGLPPAAPGADDLDQSEWDGRETSDTSAIKDLFGTEAVDQLGATGYDPHDTGTRMMPAAVAPTPARTSSPGASGSGAPVPPPADTGNFINRGFARLRGEGTRGKQLLFGGAIVIILVMLVAVFALTWWIKSNNIDEKLTPTKSPAAASASVQTSRTAAPQAAAPPASAPTIAFATTAAAPGQHPWYELAGGECLTPFTNAWAEDFTVVDCGSAHAAQLTRRGAMEADAFPGADEAKRIATDQCQSDGALDVSAASAYGDVQVQSVYPPDDASWNRGDRFWSCFVTRSGGGTMTGSLAPSA